MTKTIGLDVLDEIWDVIESVSEGFLTYSSNYHSLAQPVFDHLSIILPSSPVLLVIVLYGPSVKAQQSQDNKVLSCLLCVQLGLLFLKLPEVGYSEN